MDNGLALSGFDTFIFDLDGTLLNSLQDLALSTNWALQQNGFPCHPTDSIRMFVGNGVRKLMERALPSDVDDKTFQKVFDDFRQHYLIHSFPSPATATQTPLRIHGDEFLMRMLSSTLWRNIGYRSFKNL